MSCNSMNRVHLEGQCRYFQRQPFFFIFLFFGQTKTTIYTVRASPFFFLVLVRASAHSTENNSQAVEIMDLAQQWKVVGHSPFASYYSFTKEEIFFCWPKKNTKEEIFPWPKKKIKNWPPPNLLKKWKFEKPAMWILKIEKQPIRNRGFSTWPTLIISVPYHIAGG